MEDERKFIILQDKNIRLLNISIFFVMLKAFVIEADLYLDSFFSNIPKSVRFIIKVIS